MGVPFFVALHTYTLDGISPLRQRRDDGLTPIGLTLIFTLAWENALTAKKTPPPDVWLGRKRCGPSVLSFSVFIEKKPMDKYLLDQPCTLQVGFEKNPRKSVN